MWNTLIFTLGTLAPTILIGLANLVLSFLGLPALKWISSSKTAMLSVIIVTMWKSMGYDMVFYLSALEKVPEEETEGFTRLGPSIICILAYIVCHLSFARCLTKMNLSVGYAVWCGMDLELSSHFTNFQKRKVILDTCDE